MNRLIILFVTLTLFHTTFGNTKVRYDDFKVYRLTPNSKESAEALKLLEESESGYDFWTSVKGVGIPVDVMVPPHFKFRFNDLIRGGEFDAKLLISDVQKLIDNERPANKSTFALEWTEYHDLEEIDAWVNNLATTYPENVEIFVAGTSLEGRDMLGVKLSFQSGNENRAVFIESHIHAREWITSAVVTWILDQLLTSTDAGVRELAETHDWYIVPVTNPDGFVYSRTTDRMWRKTRTPYFLCNGADPNRNWDYHFNDGGTSAYPCSNTYRGPEAFSETSTRTLGEFITGVSSQLQAYISVHSYSQLLLIPYGYTAEHLDNYQDLYNVGIKAAESLATRYNTQYMVGNTVEVLYVASGTSVDWVKGTFGTPITYTYELRDTGVYGFLLPPEQIIPTAEETLDSLVTMFQEFDKILPKKSSSNVSETV